MFYTNQDRLISCTVSHVDENKEKYKQTFTSKTRIKEVKQTLKKQYSLDMNKRINLYYQGKEVTQDSANLGELCQKDDIDLVMISLSINEPDAELIGSGDQGNNNKLQEEVVNKMSVMCSIHPEMRQMNICLNCLISFCEQCMSQHKDHQVINKDTIVEFSNELKRKSEKMTNAFNEIGITTYTNENDGMCKDIRNDINKLINSLNEIAIGIKKRYEMIYSEYKLEFDSLFPFLLEFNEIVDSLYHKSKNEATLRYDKDFIDFYKKSIWIKNQEDKITNDFQNLKKLIQRCTNQLGDFKTQIEEIVNYANEKYNTFKSGQQNDPQFPPCSPILNSRRNNKEDTINNSNLNMKIVSELNNNQDKDTNELYRGSIYSNQAGLSSGRLNLMTLLSAPKEKRAVIRSLEKKRKKDKHKSSFNTNNGFTSQAQSQINLVPNKSIYKENNEKIKMYRKAKTTFYSFCLGNLSLLSFNSITKQMNKITIDSTQCPMKKFETYQSSINYHGLFYISGGYSTNHYFGYYDAQSNKLIALANMINGHAYHGIVGIMNYVFIVSGIKTQKVERFDLGEMKWESIAEVSSSRTYPSCVNINEKFIYVFGGICDNIKDLTKAIEKYDIIKGEWEIIELAFEEEIPIYYGVIKLSNDILMFFGGKYASNDDEVIDSFQLSINKKEIKRDESIKLSKGDEFNGKLFVNLTDNNFGGFSLYNDLFYIFNADTKVFEEFPLQNNTNSNPIAN